MAWKVISTNFIFSKYKKRKKFSLRKALTGYSKFLWPLSSLHCIISLSFCSFLYSGVHVDKFRYSVDDVIVTQKGSNENRNIWAGLYEPTEICSIVWKGHKIRPKQPNGDYFSSENFNTRVIFQNSLIFSLPSTKVHHHNAGIV